MFLFKKKKHREDVEKIDVIKVKEEFLKAPGEYKYYVILGFFHYTIALNSQEWDWYKSETHHFIFRLHRMLLIALEPVTTVSQVIYTYMNFRQYTFSELSVMLTIIPICFNIALKLLVSQSAVFKNAVKDFMAKIHLHYYYMDNQNDEYAKSMLTFIEKYNRICLYSLGGCCYICTVAWNIIPIRHNFINNPDLSNITTRLEVVTHIWLPIDYEYNFRNYVIVQSISIYCSTVGITVMFMYDHLFLVCVGHLVGHMKILRNKIETKFVEGQSESEIKAVLVDLTTHYTFIRDILATFEGAFGLNLAGIYLQNLIAGGVILYTLSSGDMDFETILTYGLMIPYLQGTLVMMSCILEYVRTLGDDLTTMVYTLNWQEMSLVNQKILLILMAQVQYLFEFNAAFNLKTGVQPAVNIIKTTFSYYVMIKSRQE